MKKKTEIKSNIIGNYFGFSYKSSLKKINTTYEKSLIIEIEDSYVVMEEHKFLLHFSITYFYGGVSFWYTL